MCFGYDPETGEVFNHFDGETVFARDSNGYIKVSVCLTGYGRRNFYGHRVAWFLMTGEWPERVDHKDRNKTNNKWDNLRLATRSQNAANAVHNKKSGLPRGVQKLARLRTRPYQARITIDGRLTHIGAYETAELASEAYELAFNSHYGAEWRPQETH